MRRRTFLFGAAGALALAAAGCTPATPSRGPQPATVTPFPSPSPAAGAAPPPEPAARITFAVNVHDWVNHDESAATLDRLCSIFEAHGVKGDFYFTPEVTRVLAERHPATIERLIASRQGISYHVRPPHPLSSGFEAPLRGLTGAALEAAILEYETFALDLETGGLDRSRPGGYRYVAEVFGTAPVTASPATGMRGLAAAARTVYRQLGARVTVIEHEAGTAIDDPFEEVDGLLARPVDFSVTRVTPIDGSDNFWWNLVARDAGGEYDPLHLLDIQFTAWQQAHRPRPPFIISHIHENNVYRRGAEAWSSIYFTITKGQRGDPLPPPWNLAAPDPSSPRSAQEQARIWDAYERLVAYAAEHFAVVTSGDIADLAG
ncbi:hypothetical protein [Tepidiforma sp.]|jgi:hypothetical protein|uniref:hypothetical protein n=1 Tax=Tepidiforma sp. TaxID=2682230 RepID=UPI002605C298|nr:hypothetical protein [Tepidiforma sp.]MCX7617953.1 hypothetical protein [Tepidiforma sp.]